MKKQAKRKPQPKQPLNLTMKMWYDAPPRTDIVVTVSWYRKAWRFLNQPINIFGHMKSHRRLVNLLHGDTAAAMRLINQAQATYPGRSGKWINEKVIQDLINDRR